LQATNKHKVAVIGYNVPQAAGCGANNTLKQFGKNVNAASSSRTHRPVSATPTGRRRSRR
jgi:hypothetical protein